MAWLDPDAIRRKFNIQENAFENQIESASDSAARKIRRWIESTYYAEASGESVPTDPEQLLRYETIVDAHAFLTMYYLAISVGHRLSNQGFIKQAQSSASPGNGTTLMNQYLTPAEISANKDNYFNEAREIIEPYAAPDNPDVQTIKRQSYSPGVRVVGDW
jgi:hypothetical protein